MVLDEKLVDKRVVARSIKQGRVDADEFRRMLQELPDLSDQVGRAAEQDPEPAAPTVAVAAPPRAETGPATF
jgi:hypothetical protein